MFRLEGWLSELGALKLLGFGTVEEYLREESFAAFFDSSADPQGLELIGRFGSGPA
jgi:hypothetical protein